MSNKNDSQSGFTIVELMIATTVLSVILLLVTVMITSIGNLYYKGTIQSQTQTNARNIINLVSQDLELAVGRNSVVSGSNATQNGLTVNSYCLSGVRYTYVLGAQIDPVGFQHVLWRDNDPGGCTPATLTGTLTGGTELIGPNTRLINFDIGSSSPYTISIGVANGADDLLCASSSSFTGTSGGCNGTGNLSQADYSADNQIVCRSGSGEQFCATATLNTVATQRLTPAN